MPIESATYIGDLQPVNPPDTDPRGQGAAHLRLIKQVLQNTFPGVERAWQVPSTKAITTSYSIVKADGESMIYCSTAGGAVTFTLPSLVAGDQGWKVRLIKTSSDANPMFIAPPTGTLNSGGVAGLAKARRCIPGVQVTAIWDGAAWFVTRALAVPIGSMIDFSGSSLPSGYEWPSGTALSSSANYPEFFAVTGSLATPDMRGRIGITLDNLGGVAAGRLPSGFINGSLLGATGGFDAVTLSMANIPSHQHAVYLHDPGHTHTTTPATLLATQSNVYVFYAGGSQGGQVTNYSINSATTGVTIGSVAGVANDNQTAAAGSVSPTAFPLIQPSVMISKLLVVE
jgi:microcystin-dependent protein